MRPKAMRAQGHWGHSHRKLYYDYDSAGPEPQAIVGLKMDQVLSVFTGCGTKRALPKDTQGATREAPSLIKGLAAADNL